MEGLIGFAILVGFNLAGVWLHNTLHIPLPGNVLGLVLFLAALGLKVIRLEWVERSAQYLLKHMLLFFIPYVVGIIAFFPVLEAHWFSIFAGIGGSTLAVLYVTGMVAKKLQSTDHNEPVTNKVGKGEAA
ncbi:CidA/LrgA family protein [Paenibacillus sp. UMB4589-SE434]|uniref:CidA/LrgA family protein n=1 Tax=Paenibacillus sp. UMB4589-SE434 TaxID=3046314 RepID=UPI00254C160D|nr:CidA/LrgA family protein [Paenibacillus sp. UMB4589-SE434]MDK8180009.1 CidA/LrgA family protein [Paenibacillus sp. UMB4589-SE434]